MISSQRLHSAKLVLAGKYGLAKDLWTLYSVAVATNAEPETQDKVIDTTGFRWPTRLMNRAIVGNFVKSHRGTVLQVSVYDTINKDAQYSLKVRRLGEYHPGLAATKDQEGQDIGDPLYGNAGGVDELVLHSQNICLSLEMKYQCITGVAQHQSKQGDDSACGSAHRKLQQLFCTISLCVLIIIA